MTETTRHRVGPLDLVKGLAAMAPSLPMLAKEGPAMLLRRPQHKNSIGLVFQKAAESHPERPFLKGEGCTLTYGEANDIVNRYAHVFEQRGVQRGDVVGLMAHNDIECILVMLAAVKLGAVAGLINYNQRGDVLAHSLGILDAPLLIIGNDCRADLDTAGSAVAAAHILTVDELRTAAVGAPATNPEVTHNITGSERALYIFTSGTTGLPKASIMTHFRWLRSYSGLGALGVRLRGADTLYCALPLYHNNAVTVGLGAVLVAGACMAVAPKFSASRFWDECMTYDATAFVYIGEFCRYLLAQPERDVDHRHSVRVIVGNGLRPDIWQDFQQRFGIDRIAEFYGASECNIAFINAFNIDQTAGTCPLPYKIVAYDTETCVPHRNSKGRLEKVKSGEVGLLLAVVNNRVPFDGYTDQAATEHKLIRDAFKDGDCWFNTGDLVRRQGLQHVAFVDRLGDTFRWKGENVATTEVEAVLSHLTWVEDCTVYGVAVPGSDGKAGMGAIVLPEDTAFQREDVTAHITASLPSYAWPLFLRVVPSLEHTSTFKSRKVELREQGFTDVGEDPVFVLTDNERGYVPIYDGYLDDVAAGRYPRLS